MNKYKTLIFDLDNTLIDNDKSMQYAFYKLLEYIGLKYDKKLFLKWQKFDDSYWHAWESGNLSIPSNITETKEKAEYLRANLFKSFFSYLNLDYKTSVKLSQYYYSYLDFKVVKIKESFELLKSLYCEYKIIIATNGPASTAYGKVQKSELHNYINCIVSSEEAGFSKPMPEFFEFLFNKINNFNTKEMLIIGDSLTTDIAGGTNSQIDTCWYNPKDLPLPPEYKPTMTINHLLELKRKL